MALRKFPFEIVEIDEDLQKKQLKSQQYAYDGCWVGPKKYFLPLAYKNHASEIYNFEARASDVYLLGVKRSGTTMHCEITWLIGNNLDYTKAQEKILDDRFPHIDTAILRHPDSRLVTKGCISLDDLKHQGNQRFIKAHLPISLLPTSIFETGSKVIYCARNPKDVIVSCFHAYKFFNNRDDSIEHFPEFFRFFKFSWYHFTPYFEHVKEAWARRNEPNFLFLFYEETIKNKRESILRMAEFLGKKLTDEELETLLNHLSMEKFRKNKSVNLEHLKDAGITNKDEHFIRKGQPGGWRDYFVGDLAREADEWIAENLRDTDLRYPEL